MKNRKKVEPAEPINTPSGKERITRMKVSKTVSIELDLLEKILKKNDNFSKVVSEALEMWLAEKTENEKCKSATQVNHISERGENENVKRSENGF